MAPRASATQRQDLTPPRPPHQVLLDAAVRFVQATEGNATMLRFAAFFLLHSGSGLTPAQVGAAVGRTDRAMRTVQALSVRDFLASVWAEMGRHRTPKLRPEHAGPIARYLVDHPRGTHAEVVSFIQRSFGITVDPLTLRRFSTTYGLGVLREPRDQEGDDERPFV